MITRRRWADGNGDLLPDPMTVDEALAVVREGWGPVRVIANEDGHRFEDADTGAVVAREIRSEER